MFLHDGYNGLAVENLTYSKKAFRSLDFEMLATGWNTEDFQLHLRPSLAVAASEILKY